MNKPTSRRAGIKATPRTYRELDKTPIEIPASRKTIPDTREMVRRSVIEALAQAGATGNDYQTVDEMIAEETDLDQIDPDPPWASQYEVTEMEDIIPELAPVEDVPLKEDEQKPKDDDDKPKPDDESDTSQKE